MDVPTNSVAIVSEDGLLKSRLRSVAQNEWMSPPPIKPGVRIKTDRRDAMNLARLLRAGELKAIWVPDPAHEAIRDLIRSRADAADSVKRGKQQLLSFLLRHGRTFTGRGVWTRSHFTWLAEQKFEHPAHQIVCQDYINAILDGQQRRK